LSIDCGKPKKTEEETKERKQRFHFGYTFHISTYGPLPVADVCECENFETVKSLLKEMPHRKTEPGGRLSLFNSDFRSVQTASVPGKWNTLRVARKPFQMSNKTGAKFNLN
jgi:hypothetical protein